MMNIPNSIDYLRMALLFLGVLCIDRNPVRGTVMLATSAFLDCIDGLASRLLGQVSLLGSVMDLLMDRSFESVLLLKIVQLYPSALLPSSALFILNLSAHWLRMTYALSHSLPCKGFESDAHPLLRLYYGNRAFMVVTIVFCDVLLVSLVASPSIADHALRSLAKGLALISLPFAFLKAAMCLLLGVDSMRRLLSAEAPAPAGPHSSEETK